MLRMIKAAGNKALNDSNSNSKTQRRHRHSYIPSIQFIHPWNPEPLQQHWQWRDVHVPPEHSPIHHCCLRFVLERCFTMVCDKCEKKMKRLAAPDPWLAGKGGKAPRKRIGPTGMSKKKRVFDTDKKMCKTCKTLLHSEGKYCPGYVGPLMENSWCSHCVIIRCAYKKGVCPVCGKKVLDTKNYAMTMT